MRLELKIPYPPSGNKTVRHGSGAHYLTAAAKSYHQEVWVAAHMQDARRDLTGRLIVRYRFWTPDMRARDLDNLMKTANDALTRAGVWRDDSQIDVLLGIRMGVAKQGAVTVCIWGKP